MRQVREVRDILTSADVLSNRTVVKYVGAQAISTGHERTNNHYSQRSDFNCGAQFVSGACVSKTASETGAVCLNQLAAKRDP